MLWILRNKQAGACATGDCTKAALSGCVDPAGESGLLLIQPSESKILTDQSLPNRAHDAYYKQRASDYPQAIRVAAGLLPNTEVEFVYENGIVMLRPTQVDSTLAFTTALKQARGVPLTPEFRGKSADEIMNFLRGE
jgi:hypothetical protein